MDLRSVADELYALPPSGFVAARNARSAEARSDGDRALADEIRRLPKPSASAWAVNQLVRQRPDEIASVLELGEALREAQDDLDRGSLTELSAQRRRLVSALAREAGGLGDGLGQNLNPSAMREIEQTLSAAMADAYAANAVRSGRLLRSLESLGFEAVDLVDAVAVPDARGAPPARRREKSATRAEVPNLATERAKRAERAEQARAEAERAVDEADRLVETADAELEDLEKRAGALEDRREEYATELDELQAAIDAVEREVATLDRDARALERESGRADRLAQQARRRAEAARERLRRLD